MPPETSDFDDERTPLPTPPALTSDPAFPTGQIPRIAREHGGDAAGLYPTWRFVSPCTTLEELARLYAPHFDGSELMVFTADTRADIGTTVALELVLSTGERVMSGIGRVVGVRRKRIDSGIRFTITSVDPDSAELLSELGENAAPLHAMATLEMHALVPDRAGEHAASARGKPRRVVYEDIATMKMYALPVDAAERDLGDGETVEMSALEIASAVGADPSRRVPKWSDLLPCRLIVGRAGECAVQPGGPPRHQTARTVIADQTRGEIVEVDETDESTPDPAESERTPDAGADAELGALIDTALGTRRRVAWWAVGAAGVAGVAAGAWLLFG